MSRVVRVLCFLSILMLAIPAAPVSAAPRAQVGIPAGLPPNCMVTTQPDQEIYLICPPDKPNGGLVVFAHGYVFANPGDPTPILPYEQLMIPNSTLTIPQLVNMLGFTFAMTSYSKNGLAVQEGMQDTLDLIRFIQGKKPELKRVYLVGASEGGLITTLLVENQPRVVNGGLAVCGPIGDFRRQINYWGDFRDVFDYLSIDPNTQQPLFPYVPGVSDAVNIPLELMGDWANPAGSVYQQKVLAWLAKDPAQTSRLFYNTKAPIVPSDPKTIVETTLGILSYNILATNEARMELSKGSPLASLVIVQPYDNTTTLYPDPLVNPGVIRYSAIPSPGAIDNLLKPYQTTGLLKQPLVTMHTRLDPIVPAWHQNLYLRKVWSTGSLWKYAALTTPRYGHCNFTAPELLFGFGLMIFKSALQTVTLEQARAILPVEADYKYFLELNNANTNITQVNLYLPLASK